MTRVELTPSEMMQAALVGIMRQAQNLKAGRRDAHGAERDNGWQIHIEGALGEFALAKHLGRYCAGTGVLRAPDVGDVDVRTTAGSHHRLILHKEDDDDRRFYLLTGVNGSYVIRGSIMGRDGKRAEYWQDPVGGRPAFFVPQSALEGAEK